MAQSGWGAEPETRLIAHRGGVVGDEFAENSLPALEAAIERGHWMVEVDIQESQDGELVVHHDANFRRFYNDPRRLADMTWEEIAQLRAKPGDSRPLRFEEFAAACRGRIELMIDTKEPEHAAKFFNRMEQALRDNGLLRNALIIGTDQARHHFLGKAKVGVDRKSLRAAIEKKEPVAERYFLFEHGNVLEQETVAWSDRQGVLVVPSVNVFHYVSPRHQDRAEADLRRLQALGVTHFQIDSVYDRVFLNDEGN